tara:strand:- start:245 stop:469 length:225 start_codon:yes stop_codon:yes gene_type:complete
MKDTRQIWPPREKVGINVRCWRCDHVTVLHAALEDIQAWQDGTLVQDAFPYLNESERELLISRTCDSCFEAMYD